MAFARVTGGRASRIENGQLRLASIAEVRVFLGESVGRRFKSMPLQLRGLALGAAS